MGAGGLVRAYSHGAAIALEAAGRITYEPYSEYELVCGYSEYQKYSVLLAGAGVLIDDTDFGALVTIRFALRKSESGDLVRKLIEMSNGRDVPKEVGERLDYR